MRRKNKLNTEADFYLHVPTFVKTVLIYLICLIVKPYVFDQCSVLYETEKRSKRLLEPADVITFDEQRQEVIEHVIISKNQSMFSFAFESANFRHVIVVRWEALARAQTRCRHRLVAIHHVPLGRGNIREA